MPRNEIHYDGNVYNAIRSGNCFLTASLPYTELQANTLSVVIETGADGQLRFVRNMPLFYVHNDKRVGTFYLQKMERVSKSQWKISATSAVGLLAQRQHLGGMYEGVDAETVIADICGSVPFVLKSDLKKIQVRGWLPIAAARDNLQQVLFAIGATVKSDLSGMLRIEELWSGLSGEQRRLYTGAKVEYTQQVTKIQLTEHQYIKNEEETELFSGEANEGDRISFDKPMHSLTASGLSIVESGANYAIVSGGSGKITGRNYTHNTRVIEKLVSDDEQAEENVKTISNATLVSFVNSASIAHRIASYYSCNETISSAAVFNGEHPGDRIMVLHPYTGDVVDAVLESSDMSLSSVVKAQEKYLVGYDAGNKGGGDVFNASVVLTGSGSWEVPEDIDADEIRVVLIAGGTGGAAGKAGETGGASMVESSESGTSIKRKTMFAAPSDGGEGGAPGESGKGGKIAIHVLSVSPGMSFGYACGVGGAGAVFGSDAEEGAEGGQTTFGDYTSSSGASRIGGFVEELSGIVYAAQGEKGVKGGNGSGAYSDAETGEVIVVPGENVFVDGMEYAAGATPREPETWSRGRYDTGNGYIELTHFCGNGGGAAYMNNGANGASGTMKQAASASYVVTGGAGGAGADAAAPPKASILGAGGAGGNGGGGGGAAGAAISTVSYSANLAAPYQAEVSEARPGTGGAGSDGGQGADGCVIVYYRKKEAGTSGALRTSNGKFLLDKTGRIIVV